MRQSAIKDRATHIKRFRGLLSVFGIIMPQGRYPAQTAIGSILEDGENNLPSLRVNYSIIYGIKGLNEEILKYDRKRYALANQMKDPKRFMTIPDIGKSYATAMMASVNDAKHFDTNRSFSE